MTDRLILVDGSDREVGSALKEDCHLGDGKLHRAFSVLLFNSNGELLIQKRASDKITFPAIWANSCCSHPLYRDSERNGVEGAKKLQKGK